MNADKKAQTRPMNWVRTIQRKLYRAAKENIGRKFGLLYSHVCEPATLEEAWKRVSSNGGAPGVDGITTAMVKEKGSEDFLGEIREELKNGTYRTEKIRRIFIPKGKSGKRPLGLPTVKDKVVQMAVKLIIEPLFEVDFKDCSHGFRPNRSNQGAAEEAHKYSNTHKYILDVDLKSYFDTIDHGILMELLRKRISDPAVLGLVKQWLKAGILENGIEIEPGEGTPQGSVVSPLLSNIVLHEIDKLWHDNETVKLVRFADDMVFMCRSRRQAHYVLAKLKGQLEELKLTLNMEKTKIRHVRETFDFVGFTYKETYSRKWDRLVRVKYPREKSRQGIRDKIKSAVKEFQLGTDLKEVIGKVNTKVRGWMNYFKIGMSYKQAQQLDAFVCQQLRIYMRRCKHRKDTKCYGKWPNSFFYKQGVYYAPNLLSK